MKNVFVERSIRNSFDMTINSQDGIEVDSALSCSSSTDDTHLWFLAYTRPGHEHLAQQHLQRQAVESYLPLYKRPKKFAAEVKPIFEPMFPRYLFFRPSQAGQSIAPVRSTSEISHIVRFGDQPATIASQTLAIIRRLEQERNATDEATLDSLQAAQKDLLVHLLEGLIKSAASRRVAALLELMGQQQMVSIDHLLLELV